MEVNTLEEIMTRLTASARAGGANELDIVTVRLLVLERYKLETLQLAMRVKHHEQSMYSSMDSGERCVAICACMGLSERRFYELKKLAAAIPDRSDY